MNKYIGLISIIVIGLFILGIIISQKSQPVTQNPIPTPTIPSPASEIPSASISITKVNLYFIALNDNGKVGPKVGCGDSLEAFPIDIPQTQTPLQNTYSYLLGNYKGQYIGVGGIYYNALYQSHLNLTNAVIENGVATIKLSGQVQLGGVCDNPRFKAQLEQIALQFPTVQSVKIFINDKSIDEVISQK